MLERPAIADADLAAALEAGYGIAVAELVFTPLGKRLSRLDLPGTVARWRAVVHQGPAIDPSGRGARPAAPRPGRRA